MPDHANSRTPRRLVRDSIGGLIAALHGSAALNRNSRQDPKRSPPATSREGARFFCAQSKPGTGTNFAALAKLRACTRFAREPDGRRSCGSDARDKMNGLFEEEYHAHPIEHQPILLSSAAVSDEKDSHRKPTSRPVSASFTAIRNCRRSSAATTPAHAVQAAAFKNCCLKTGSYDGERRNHFFQRLAVSSVGPISRGRCMRRPSMPCFRRERDRRFTRCNRRGVGESSPGYETPDFGSP